jgi:hypothetical protein
MGGFVIAFAVCMWAQKEAHLEPVDCKRRNSHEESVRCRIPILQKCFL